MKLAKYREMFRAGFRKQSQYRLATAASLISSILYIVLLFSIWSSIAASGNLEGGLQRVLSYIVVGQVISQVASSTTEQYFDERIRHGKIVNDLKRPVSLRMQAYMDESGKRAFNSFTRAAPLLLIGLGFAGLKMPSFLNFLAFLATLFLSYHMVFALSYCTGLLVFWTKVGNGLRFGRSMIINLFSGVVFPLYLLPEGLKELFFSLPFHLIADGPINVFLMETRGAEIMKLIGQQLLWIAVFWILGYLIWRKAKKKLTVQGG